ncbi:MAG: fibronectin type III domain-containing protein [Propionibacteriaceae bacterium]|jgi:alpha-tubulin suppressor-like RCC1 family protein|nr:fibronectin type III domain-containing protein [Propionibacteriaceae bacterium]
MNQSATPARLGVLLALALIAALTPATPARAQSGMAVWAWGSGDYGQLGDGGTADRATAAKVANLGDVVSLATDGSTTLAATGDGSLWAWGYNKWGLFADDSTQDRSLPAQVKAFSGVKSVQTNGSSAFATTAAGATWAWGDNQYGQLGLGVTDASAQTKPAKFAALTRVTQLAVGSLSVYALRDDGTVWAWGYNGIGQLGDGEASHQVCGKPRSMPEASSDCSPTPVRVASLTSVTSIAVGESAAYAVKSDGTVWAWGDNSSGQLGDGESSHQSCWEAGSALVDCSTTPVKVAGLSNVAAVAASTASAYAVKSDGTVWAWGDNSSGQLGDGTFTKRSKPVQAAVTGVASVSAGGSTAYALKSDGSLWAWGYNHEGRLGDGVASHQRCGGSDCSPTPVRVVGPSDVKAVVAGPSAAYALADGPAAACLSCGAVAKAANLAWSGQAAAPSVTLTLGGRRLVAGVDYTVTVSSGVAIGKATAVVTAKNLASYTGSLTVSYKIVPKATKLTRAAAGANSAKIAWKKVSAKQKITKYQVRYRLKGGKVWTTKNYSAKKSKATVKGLASGRSYVFQVRSYKTVSGVKYYSAWSKSRTAKNILQG